MPQKYHVALVRGPILFTKNALNNEATPSIAFAYLTAYLESQGHTVTVIDSVAEGLNNVWAIEEIPPFQCQGLELETVVERIPDDVDVIGFSAMFSGEWPLSRLLINKIRERFTEQLIVAGGEHATALPEYSLRDCPALDGCIHGEGEGTFAELLQSYAETGNIHGVNGVSYLDGDWAFHPAPSPSRIREISSIPWPHWKKSYLEKFWKAGKSFGIASKRDMPIMASRGCPYQCTFCSNTRMWTPRYILREVEDLVAEIKLYVERFDITALQFYDLTAIVKKSWTIQFCKRLADEGIHLQWSLPSGTRSEALDRESLTHLKNSGCAYLVYSPESGCKEMLKKIKKRIKLENLTKSMLTAKELGITVRANLIIGFPGETRSQIFKTIFYGWKLTSKGIDELSLNVFSPYPGTEIFDELIEADKLTINDEYFLRLTSLNSDYTATSPINVNGYLSTRELALYRFVGLLLSYLIGYVCYPKRILRTIRNVFISKSSHATTVLEHRLKDALNRKRKN